MASNYRSAEFPLDSTFAMTDDGITVDQMLQEPTRITRYVNEVVNQNLLSEKLFSSTPVSGGILIYNQILGKISDEKTKFRSNVREPGGEFAEIDQTQIREQWTKVRQIGGRVAITDEAVKRNDTAFLQKELRRLANMMVRDIDLDAIKAFNDAVDALPLETKDATQVASVGWNQTTKTKAADVVPANQIIADLEALRLRINEIDLGYNYSTLLVSPKRESDLRISMGAQNAQALLSSYGWNIEVSPHVADTEAWLLAPKQVGVLGVETPTTTTPWRDEAHLTTHTQTYTTLGHAITDPMALLHLTGIEK